MIALTDRPKRVAIYCRVSSAGQEDNSSLATQEASCRAYAAERDWAVTEVYRDVHTGAEVFERPGLTALRADMRAGRLDVLLVHALDRLSRDQNHQGLVLSEAEHAGVIWDSATEDIDNTPTGKILRAVIGGMAELERLKIAERTQRGMRARVESGKIKPGSKPPYGYQWSGEDKATFRVDPLTAPIAQRIFQEISRGGSARQTALGLTRDTIPTPTGRSNYWQRTSVIAIIRNPVYTGTVEAFRWQHTRTRGGYRKRERAMEDRILLENVAPPLVSKETWDAVQQRVSSNQLAAYRNNRKPEDTLLRGGHVLCGYCDRPMHVFRSADRIYYRCTQTNRDRHGCPAHRILAEILDEAVWSKVEAILTDATVLSREVAKMRRDDGVSADIEAIDRRTAEVERQRANLTRRIATIDDDETAPPLLVEIRSLGAQVRRLQSDRGELETARESWKLVEKRLDDLDYWCRVQAENLAGLTYEEKRLALLALNVEARVWRVGHDPRYEIKMRIDVEGREDPKAIANTSS